MKKTLKVLGIVVLVLVMLLALTGCGNKVIATKDVDEDGVEYKQRIEYKFKGDKVENIKMTMTFKDKDTAEKMNEQLEQAMSLMSAFGGGIDIEPELKGKKIIMEIDVKEYAEMAGVDEDEIESTSKKELKEELKEQGYKVR